MSHCEDASRSDTPPSVNSKLLFMSSVCGNIDHKVSVPIIASVLKSHTTIGNSVLSPKNDTMQEEQPEMSICDPLADRFPRFTQRVEERT